MANRPVFVPMKNSEVPGVKVIDVEFQWFPGMATSQKKKSIKSLHEAVRKLGISPILEVSSKSEEEIGVSLSAFNLMIETANKKYKFSVESAFQASKVFERGGPYADLLNKSSKEAKRDIRLKESGNLIGFNFFGKEFPIKPVTFFYDWLYVHSLNQNQAMAKKVLYFSGFSDIEFNPKKSLNCQARSLALYISLVSAGALEDALSTQDRFFEIAYQSGNDKGST
ncbi:DarT1-associated NADAR antitoxin family protein, partial [Vreelandella alkaliphila]|uniref:DarT1-associated NADAR antitoxin family protein n=1 Tax=Vreelandella alkaliphila TaxID=272774 RepID=UPI003FD6F19B